MLSGPRNSENQIVFGSFLVWKNSSPISSPIMISKLKEPYQNSKIIKARILRIILNSTTNTVHLYCPEKELVTICNVSKFLDNIDTDTYYSNSNIFIRVATLKQFLKEISIQEIK